jgi:hypothetical protein
VQVFVLVELGAETHVCFPVEARRVPVETGSDDHEDDASLLAGPATLFTARVDARTCARQGSTASLAVDPSRFHFFDPDNGSSLEATKDAGAAPLAAEWS